MPRSRRPSLQHRRRGARYDRPQRRAHREALRHGRCEGRRNAGPTAPSLPPARGPDMIVVVPDAQLEALAALRPAEPPRAARRRAGSESFDVRAWLAEHGLAVVPEKPWVQGAQVRVLAACAFADAHEHHQGEAAVILLASGMLLYKCQHATCVGREWADVRERFDGPHPAAKARSETASARTGAALAPDAVRLTDVGNARRLVATYEDAVRYCAVWKKWLLWGGRGGGGGGRRAGGGSDKDNTPRKIRR